MCISMAVSYWCQKCNIYININMNIHTNVHVCLNIQNPPDPIHVVCSLPDCQISGNCLSYRPVQILKMLFRGSNAPESDLPQKIKRYWIYWSTWLASSFQLEAHEHDLEEFFCTSKIPAPKKHIRGWPLNIFTWFIDPGARTDIRYDI